VVWCPVFPLQTSSLGPRSASISEEGYVPSRSAVFQAPSEHVFVFIREFGLQGTAGGPAKILILPFSHLAILEPEVEPKPNSEEVRFQAIRPGTFLCSSESSDFKALPEALPKF